jgi:hypothetical protein
MALVNDYRPASKNNTEAVVVELDGRPHVFYVATRAIPANTEVREEERGAGGLTDTGGGKAPAFKPPPMRPIPVEHHTGRCKTVQCLTVRVECTVWMVGVHRLRAQLLGRAGDNPPRARANNSHHGVTADRGGTHGRA